MGKVIMALGCLLALLSSTSFAQPPQKLGEVAFANSGAAEAQAPFLRGLALLHNFEYESAAEAFKAAQNVDPDFVMAYWGEAMTHNHAVWMEQDTEAARAVLSRLAPTREARARLARTARETAYLAAVETLYGEGAKEARDDLYSAAMERLHTDYPADIDATAFYALSLLGTAHEGRDFATYMRAAALLEAEFPTNMHHPGVLHYLIHSYDDPVHAPLGLRAARLYGAVAPEAPHALHMTSHIFIALGMWDDVISANISATRSENAAEVARGEPAIACFHYEEWLVYGYLQKGDLKRADERIAACRQSAEVIHKMQPMPARFYQGALHSYSDMLVRRAVETGEWSTDLMPRLDNDTRLATRINLAYGEALTAMADPARLQAAADRLHDAVKKLESRPFTAGSEAQQAQVLAIAKLMDEEIAALALFTSGKTDAGFAALKLAVAKEVAAPMEFGPPAIPKPALELLGDLLLLAGRPVEAADAYSRALARTPGRTMVLAGLARAQAAAALPPTKAQPMQPPAAKTPPAEAHRH
jgi:tetratricopeptide (TPR) repeat protein